MSNLTYSTNAIQLSDTCDVTRHDKDVTASVNMTLYVTRPLPGCIVYMLCIVAPPVGTTSRRVRFVFFYRTSYVGSTSRQHLVTVIRSTDCVKQPFQTSRRRQRDNIPSFITRLLRLWSYPFTAGCVRMCSGRPMNGC